MSDILGIRQGPSASFRQSNSKFRRVAAASDLWSSQVGLVKNVASEGFKTINIPEDSSKAILDVWGGIGAALALPGGLIGIADAAVEARDPGWQSKAAAGAAASHQLVTDLGKVAIGVAVFSPLLGLSPIVLPAVGVGLTIVGAGLDVWDKSRKREASRASSRDIFDGPLDPGGGSGSMLERLRDQLAQLTLQLDRFGTALGDQETELRQRGHDLSGLIGGSRAEDDALRSLFVSIKALRRSRSSISEAKKSIQRLKF